MSKIKIQDLTHKEQEKITTQFISLTMTVFPFLLNYAINFKLKKRTQKEDIIVNNNIIYLKKIKKKIKLIDSYQVVHAILTQSNYASLYEKKLHKNRELFSIACQISSFINLTQQKIFNSILDEIAVKSNTERKLLRLIAKDRYCKKTSIQEYYILLEKLYKKHKIEMDLLLKNNKIKIKEQMANSKEILRSSIRDSGGFSNTKLIHNYQEQIGALGKPSVPWNIVLREFLNTITDKQKSASKFSRRGIITKTYSKGFDISKRVNPDVYVDVSGSVTVAELKTAFTEVYSLINSKKANYFNFYTFNTEVTFVSKITESDNFEKLKLTKTNGGTSIDPVFMNILTTEPELVIIFTDLDFSVPTNMKLPTTIVWIVNTSNNTYKNNKIPCLKCSDKKSKILRIK